MGQGASSLWLNSVNPIMDLYDFLPLYIKKFISMPPYFPHQLWILLYK